MATNRESAGHGRVNNTDNQAGGKTFHHKHTHTKRESDSPHAPLLQNLRACPAPSGLHLAKPPAHCFLLELCFLPRYCNCPPRITLCPSPNTRSSLNRLTPDCKYSPRFSLASQHLLLLPFTRVARGVRWWFPLERAGGVGLVR